MSCRRGDPREIPAMHSLKRPSSAKAEAGNARSKIPCFSRPILTAAQYVDHGRIPAKTPQLILQSGDIITHAVKRDLPRLRIKSSIGGQRIPITRLAD